MNFIFCFFFLFSLIELPLYLSRHKKKDMARRAVVSEVCHMGVIAGGIALDWRFGVTVFLVPYVTCRFMMMVGNWGQHAFFNTARKNNGIANSVTCINSGYNRRCFNDGYHIGHHLKATMHWSELPGELAKNRADYAANGSLVLSGTDFFMVWAMLMTKQHARIAAHHVHVGSGPKPTRSGCEVHGRHHRAIVWVGFLTRVNCKGFKFHVVSFVDLCQ